MTGYAATAAARTLAGAIPKSTSSQGSRLGSTSPGMRLANFMAASDTPLQLDERRWLDVLVRYKIDGQPVFDLSQEQHGRRLLEVMAMATTMDHDIRAGFTLESAGHIRARAAGVRVITDDNMGTEWLQ